MVSHNLLLKLRNIVGRKVSENLQVWKVVGGGRCVLFVLSSFLAGNIRKWRLG